MAEIFNNFFIDSVDKIAQTFVPSAKPLVKTDCTR